MAAAQSGNPLAATVERRASSAPTPDAPTTGEVSPTSADPSTAPIAAPPIPDSTSAAPTPPPSAAQPAVDSEPQKDESVLERLPDLSTNYLIDLLGLYHRLDNQRMIDAVTGELRKRDPSGSTLSGFAETLPGGADSDDDGAPDQPDSPFDSVEDHADRLMNLERFTDAVSLLEESKNTLGAGAVFPLEGQLASAYLAAGRKDDAISAFRRVASGASYPAAKRAEARNELAEIQRSDAIADAYATMAAGDRKEALELARGLSSAHPNDPEVDLLLGQTLVAAGLHREALPILERLKTSTPAGQTFAGQADYADALYNNNQLNEAQAAYEELESDLTQPETLRYEARLTSREIYKKTANSVFTHGEYLHEEEGDRGLIEVEASAEVRRGLKIGAFGWYDYVALSKDRSLLRDSGYTTGGYAYAKQQIGGQHFIDARVGGANYQEVLYGLGLGRQAPNELFWGWKAGYYGNDRALDSLPLIALGGRENRIDTSVSGPLPFGMKLAVRGAYRRVYAEDADLGEGFITEFSVSRSMWNDNANRRSLNLAYEGMYERFDSRKLSTGEAGSLGLADPTTGALFSEELIQPRYHAQGLALTFDHDISDHWSSYITLAANYNFETEQIDWYTSLGVSYEIADNLELLLDASYYSDGTAIASTGSEIIVANLGLRYLY